MLNFDRNQHVFHSPDFAEIIKDTIRFFNGTPVLPIPTPERFHGTGVYALYCTAQEGIYSDFHKVNRTAYNIPIYIGKAVPKGWRMGRSKVTTDSKTYELNNRLREHGKSLQLSQDLNTKDFHTRFMILEKNESDLIGTVEAALIRKYQPLWNTLLDGFGNHDPGKGRYEQAMSDWDVCHPGRLWAKKCRGIHSDRDTLLKNITEFIAALKDKHGNS